MTLLDTILVFLGIKTEAEIKEAQRRTEIIAALKEEIEQEKVQNRRIRVELVCLNNKVYRLETGGRHTEALNRACVVERKKECLRVSEHILDIHRETLASLEAGGELDETWVLWMERRRMMRPYDTPPYDPIEPVPELEPLVVLDEDDDRIMGEYAEAALAKIMAEFAK